MAHDCPLTELEKFRHDKPSQVFWSDEQKLAKIVMIGIKLFLWFVSSLLLNRRLQSQFQLSWIPHSASFSCCEAYSQPKPKRAKTREKASHSSLIQA